MTTQPEALYLADLLEHATGPAFTMSERQAIAAELRRLHALNQELLEALKQCQTALEALWQPADSIYQRAADAADRAIAKAEGGQHD